MELRNDAKFLETRENCQDFMNKSNIIFKPKKWGEMLKKIDVTEKTSVEAPLLQLLQCVSCFIVFK